MTETTSKKLKLVPLPNLISFVFDKKQQEIARSQYQPISQEIYEESCQKAELLGYKSVEKKGAYGGVYYINEQGEKWIHRLANLAFVMDFNTLQDAEDAGYTVDDYLEYVDITSKELEALLAQREMQSLYDDLRVSYDEDEPVYLCDGVYLNSEGEIVDTKPWK